GVRRATIGLQRSQARADPARRGDRAGGAGCRRTDPRPRPGARRARAAAGRGPRAAGRRGRLLVQVVSRQRGSRGLRVIAGSARDVSRFLAAGPPTDAPFDLVFVDPPYDTADEEITELLATLLRPGWLAREAIVSVERPRRHPVVVPAGLSNRWERSFGDTLL